MSNRSAAAHVLVKGRVQGVGFRFFAQDEAVVLHLKGWVRNLPGGEVEGEAEGAREDIERWIAELRKGPPMASVDTVEVNWQPPGGQFTDFSIR